MANELKDFLGDGDITMFKKVLESPEGRATLLEQFGSEKLTDLTKKVIAADKMERVEHNLGEEGTQNIQKSALL